MFNIKAKNVGETICVPPSFSSRRSSQPRVGLFDFKNKTIRNKSLSNEKSLRPSRRYSRKDNTIDVSENIK